MALFIQYDLKLENECYDSAQMFHALCVHKDKRACGSLCHSSLAVHQSSVPAADWLLYPLHDGQDTFTYSDLITLTEST